MGTGQAVRPLFDAEPHLIHAIRHFDERVDLSMMLLGNHTPAGDKNALLNMGRDQVMKSCALLCVIAMAISVKAQDKPRVFVQGKGSENVSSTGSGGGGQHWAAWGSKSTIDSHDESMEVTKDLQKECSGAMITINQANADYIVMMNRESKKNRGLLRTNSQISGGK